MSKGKLTIIGDSSSNSISLEAGSTPGYFRVSGMDGTTANSRTAPIEFGPVTRSIRVRLGRGDDNLVLDGTAGAMVLPGRLVVSDAAGDTVSLDRDDDERTQFGSNNVTILDALLERGLTVRMRSADDVVTLCGVTSSGRVRVRTRRGSDSVLIDDSMLYDVVRVATGRGSDVVAIEATDRSGPLTEFHQCVRLRTSRGNDAITLGTASGSGNSLQTRGCTRVRGGRGQDSLNAGLGSNPNSNGNEFAQPLIIRGIDQQWS
jgi:hypothetical protein